MKKDKIKKLEKAGWKVGSVSDFLNLKSEEEAIIDIKISLAKKFQNLRKSVNLTQVQVAKVLNISQSGVARMEACDPSVSMELLIKGLLSLGESKQSVGQAFASA
ncbi:Transcriptional regulator [Candidatus Magnetomoraceae bacterium gMMP-15]